jgi:hydrogenase nickel incorporation protein HypA/HybF
MHELGIAIEIAELASERAGDRRPTRVVVEVGQLTAVLPDALAFAWQAATEGSALGGCELDLDMPFGRCACGGTDLELVAGEELRIRHMEVT